MNTFGRLHSSGKVISTKKLYSCLFLCLAKVKPSRLILLLLLKKKLASADNLVAKALSYFQEQLLIRPENFHLSEEEKQFLNVPLQEIPLESPKFLFYDNEEWTLHFAEGGFSFCEPYGVSFHFKDEKPILIENLEDSEEI